MSTLPQDFDKPDSLKAMLELDLNMDKQDVEHCRAHAELAEELGLVDVQIRLEEIAADEAGYARELRRLLKGL